MTLRILADLEQGSQDWHDQRRGMVTASMVGQLISVGAPDALTIECPDCHAEANSPCLSATRKVPTPMKTIHAGRSAKASTLPPTYSPAKTDVSRGLTALLTAERITGYTEPTFQSDDMWRGVMDEPIARDLYSKHYAPATECGFMVRDDWGFEIGYSPDGLVGDNGLIEVKSRRQKKQLLTVLADDVPAENMAQLQCGLLISGRKWIDYVSFSGGMPMWRKRATPDQRWFDAIIAAVAAFERASEEMTSTYLAAVEGLPATERIDHNLEVVI